MYINKLVLDIYRGMSYIQFPINPQELIAYIPNCRYMSYQKFAEINNCSIEDVIAICESKSGCTHYDAINDRYLILCNQSTKGNNNIGRQRWTCGHEIGHILCGHHSMSSSEKLSENNSSSKRKDFETEADYFAAMLLAPFPLFKVLNIDSPYKVRTVFGLSREASEYRYEQYLKWRRTRFITAWENDFIKLYNRKS